MNPSIGEIKKSEEIGFKSKSQKWIWVSCQDCSKERWVLLKKGKPQSLRCHSCAAKLNMRYLQARGISDETRAKRRLQVSGVGNPMFGRHHSDETKEKMRRKRLNTQNMKGPRPSINRDKNPNYRGGRIIHCDNCGAELYRCPYRIRDHNFCNFKCMGEWQSQSSEFLALVLKANQIKPNKKELALLDIIQELSLPYSYVGDGDFILGGKCPDFLNTNGQKKLIELWGNFWHKGQDPQERIDYFKQYGFQTLVIWESELAHSTDLKEKLLSFDREIARY